jgi:methyl-accepting chemotaxis protein
MPSLSIKKTAPLMFLAPLLTCVGLMGWIALESSQRTANNFSQRMMKTLSEQVKERLNNYLNAPLTINNINADAIEQGQLNLQNLTQVEHHFWHQTKTFKYVSGIQFGYAERGQLQGIVREKNGDKEVLEFNIANDSTNMANTIYAVDEKGNRAKELRRRPNYDARKRPWYKKAVEVKKPAWTEIFGKKTSAESQLRLSAVHPVYEKGSDKLKGVLAVDFFLTEISDFLHEIKKGQSKGILIFIVERSGDLVATSSDAPVFIDEGNSEDSIKQIAAIKSQERMIQATAVEVDKKFQGGFSGIQKNTPLKFSPFGEAQRVQIQPFKELGLDWLVVVIVPEKEFMQGFERTKNVTIVLGIGALAFSVILGLLVTRWLINPILQLNTAATQIKADEFDPKSIAPIAQRSDEIGQLAQVFEEMAEVVYSREQSLKDRVQQLMKETDQAKKAALAKQIAGNLDVEALLVRSQIARQNAEKERGKE